MSVVLDRLRSDVFILRRGGQVNKVCEIGTKLANSGGSAIARQTVCNRRRLGAIEQEMSQIPLLDTDPIWIAFTISICELFAAQTVTLQKVLELVESKGLLSETEIKQAMASIPPESLATTSAALQKCIRERVELRYKEILLLSSPDRPTQ